MKGKNGKRGEKGKAKEGKGKSGKRRAEWMERRKEEGWERMEKEE